MIGYSKTEGSLRKRDDLMEEPGAGMVDVDLGKLVASEELENRDSNLITQVGCAKDGQGLSQTDAEKKPQAVGFETTTPSCRSGACSAEETVRVETVTGAENDKLSSLHKCTTQKSSFISSTSVVLENRGKTGKSDGGLLKDETIEDILELQNSFPPGDSIEHVPVELPGQAWLVLDETEEITKVYSKQPDNSTKPETQTQPQEVITSEVHAEKQNTEKPLQSELRTTDSNVQEELKIEGHLPKSPQDVLLTPDASNSSVAPEAKTSRYEEAQEDCCPDVKQTTPDRQNTGVKGDCLPLDLSPVCLDPGSVSEGQELQDTKLGDIGESMEGVNLTTLKEASTQRNNLETQGDMTLTSQQSGFKDVDVSPKMSKESSQSDSANVCMITESDVEKNTLPACPENDKSAGEPCNRQTSQDPLKIQSREKNTSAVCPENDKSTSEACNSQSGQDPHKVQRSNSGNGITVDTVKDKVQASLKEVVATTSATHQSFSDGQQVQLRAQILVYGSLIQGSLPDEALMSAAFADVSKVVDIEESLRNNFGGEKSRWEKVWQLASERIQRKKSSVVGTLPHMTTLTSPTGIHGFPANIGNGPFVSAANTMPGIPVPTAKGKSVRKGSSKPSPEATTSGFPSTGGVGFGMSNLVPRPRGSLMDLWQHPAKPRFPYAQSAPFTGSAWMPPSSLTIPWLTSAVSVSIPFPSSPHFPDIPRVPSCTTNMPYNTPPAITPSLPPVVSKGGLMAANDLANTDKGKLAAGIGHKSKRRRKVQVVDRINAIDQGDLTSKGLAEASGNIHGVSPITLATVHQITTSHTPASEGNHQSRSLSEDFEGNLEQARQKAEEAALAAARAMERSQSIWKEMNERKEKKLVSEENATFASSAAAISAAVSVAKAAAAAANVAYAAALQAKLMANEAISSSSSVMPHVAKSGILADSRVGGHHQGENEMASNATWQIPGPFRSVISAAKEATTRHAMAASAVCKRAENLQAVVRAAELAAEAACQAGMVLSMGDPIQSADVRKTASLKVTHGKRSRQERRARKIDVKKSPSGKTTKNTKEVEFPPGDRPNIVSDEAANQDTSSLVAPVEEEVDAAELLHISSDVPSCAEEEPAATQPSTLENEITEGSIVEVVPDDEGLDGVWFSGKVLRMEDERIFVLYDELLADDGKGQLREWVSIRGKDTGPPKVRLAHPMIHDDGARKRRRAAIGSQTWSAGDHVDAWMRDGWWEGVVTAISEEDQNLVTVHFPGDGDTDVIKSWNLRPSLAWDGKSWIPWKEFQAQNQIEDVSHPPKQSKLDNEEPEEPGKLDQNDDADIVNKKSGSMENVAKRGNLSGSGGLLSALSKLTYGIPKPTKKRKFMDFIVKNDPSNKHASKSANNTDKRVNQGATKRKKPAYMSEESDTSLNKVHKKKVEKHQHNQGKDSDGAKPSKDSDVGRPIKGSAQDPESIDQEPGEKESSAIQEENLSQGLATGADKQMPGNEQKRKLNSPSELAMPTRNSLSRSAEKEVSTPSALESEGLRKSNRLIHPTSKLLEGLQSSPQGGKKNGPLGLLPATGGMSTKSSLRQS